MTYLEQFFVVKQAAAELAPSMLSRLAAGTFRKPLVRLRGPLGEFLVRHDGYYNPSVAAFTAMQDVPGIENLRGTPGMAPAGSSFSSMSMARAGYAPPKILPFHWWKALKPPPFPQGTPYPKVAGVVGQAPVQSATSAMTNVSQTAGRLGNTLAQSSGTSNLPYFSRLFPMSGTDTNNFQQQLKGRGILDFFGKKLQGAEYNLPTSTFQPSNLFPIWRP